MYRRHKYPTDFYEIIKNIFNKMTWLPGLCRGHLRFQLLIVALSAAISLFNKKKCSGFSIFRGF